LGAAEAAAAGFTAATAAVRAGAATATSSVFFVTFFEAAVLVAEAVAAFIIPWAEEETEDILRRTYCLCELGNHFLPEIFAPGIQ
jgi:hypothetical protein